MVKFQTSYEDIRVLITTSMLRTSGDRDLNAVTKHLYNALQELEDVIKEASPSPEVFSGRGVPRYSNDD